MGAPFLRNVSQLLEIHPGPPRPPRPPPPLAPPASRSLRLPPALRPRAPSSRAGSARLRRLRGRRRGRAARAPSAPRAPPGGLCLHAVCNRVGGGQGPRSAAPGSSPARLPARPLAGSRGARRGGVARGMWRGAARREGPGAPLGPQFPPPAADRPFSFLETNPEPPWALTRRGPPLPVTSWTPSQSPEPEICAAVSEPGDVTARARPPRLPG